VKRLQLALVLGTVLGVACGGRELVAARVAPLFGPVVSRDTISGYVTVGDSGVLLMVGGTTLVSIDLQTRTQRAYALALKGAERCWGLARLADGSLWSLKGMNAAIQITPEGSVAREMALAVAQLGVYGVGERLVLEPGSLPAGEPVLFAGLPGEESRVPWGGMRARPFESLAMGAAAALNLVGCGQTRSAELPCWFPDEPVVFLITSDGTTRRVGLEGLPRAVPEILINARVPQRPIRDVYVERDGTLWVISTGTPAAGAGDLPGGWLLLRYGRRGEFIDQRLLSEPARIILRAERGRALVLTGAGMVAEVQP